MSDPFDTPFFREHNKQMDSMFSNFERTQKTTLGVVIAGWIISIAFLAFICWAIFTVVTNLT